jgi:hypothetical protein
MAAMTILDEIQTSLRQHAEGAGGTLELRVVRGADERTVRVVFTPEIKGN